MTNITNRPSVYSADMPRNSPIEGSLRRRPGMEAVELLVMDSEYHKLPILRAECCIGPNAAKALLEWITAKSASAGDATPKLRVNMPSAQASRVIIASLLLVQTDYVPALPERTLM